MFIVKDLDHIENSHYLNGEFITVERLLSQHSVADALAQVPGIVDARVTEDYHLRYRDVVCAVVTVTNARGQSTEVVTVGDARQDTESNRVVVRLKYIKIEACDQGWGDSHVLRLDMGELVEDVVTDWVYNLRHWAEGHDVSAEPSDIQLLQQEVLKAERTLRDAVVRRVHQGKNVAGTLWSLARELDVTYAELEEMWLEETRHATPLMVVCKLTVLIGCPMPKVHAAPPTRNSSQRNKVTLLPQFSDDGLWRVAYDRERTVLVALTPEDLIARIEQHFRSTPREQWLEGARIEAPAQWRRWL